MKRFITFLVLVITVVAVIVLMRKSAEQRAEDAVAIREPMKVLDVSPGDILGIEIVGMRSEYSLSRISDQFMLLGVDIDNVNQEAIQSSLNAICELSPMEEFSSDVTDDELSLGGYEILKIRVRGDRNYELRISDNPLTNNTRAVKMLLNDVFIGQRFRISYEDYSTILPLREKLLK